MRYISIALSPEGSTDEAFLWPIVYRTALSLATNAVVGEAAYFIRRTSNAERIKEICRHTDEFDIFIIHADATRAAQRRINETIVDAVRDGVVASCAIDGGRVVGLVTVSEMESWALASRDAIAESLGFNGWPDRILLHWDLAEVETLTDPKQALRSAFETLLNRPVDPETLHETLEAIANRIPLEALAALPSYRVFRDNLRICLTMLRAAR